MKKKYSVLMALMIMDIGGVETHVMELSLALAKMGVDVHVVSNGGVYVDELTAAGITHYKLPLHNKQPQNLIKSYKGLKRIIRENDIRLVHAHARIPAMICGMVCREMNIHFVTSAHFNFNTDFPFNVLSKWGEKTIAVSDDIKKYLMDNYKLPEKSIVTTVNGINTDRFNSSADYSDILAEFGLNPAKKRIVHVCRLIKANDLATRKLLEAAPGIYKKFKDIEIIIVGDGADFDFLKKKADEINDGAGEKFVYMTGPRPDVNKFIAASTIFVGVSRAALEAMAAKRPVVMAGPQGYVGIFDKSKEDVALGTNFCFRNTDMPTAENLEGDISALLAMTPEERQRLGDYGFDIVKAYYSVEKMAQDAKDVYDGVWQQPLRNVDVMVSGYYGSRNSGDDALLEAIVGPLKKLNPNVNIIALSRRPSETRENFKVNSIYWLNFFRIALTMRKTKLLIIGGGNLMQDGTSKRNLFYYLQMIYGAKRFGAKVMLYANGIGPLNHESSKLAVEKCLNTSVNYITLRENQSRDELKAMGVVRPPMSVTADAAFGLETAESSGLVVHPEINKSEALPNSILQDEPPGCDYFIVSVRRWHTVDPAFEQKIADICDYIKGKYHLQAVFVSMHDQYDFKISQRVCSKMKLGGVFLTEKYSVPQMMGIVKGSKLTLGMRLHTVIYAAKAGVPVIGLVYDPKVQNMMEYMGQRFYTPVADVDYNAVIGYADYIMGNHDEISLGLAEVSDRLRRKTEENTEIAAGLINDFN